MCVATVASTEASKRQLNVQWAAHLWVITDIFEDKLPIDFKLKPKVTEKKFWKNEQKKGKK